AVLSLMALTTGTIFRHRKSSTARKCGEALHIFGNKIRGGSFSAHRPTANRTRKEAQMLGTILLIILILLLIGALPNWGYSRGWGYGPSGGLGLIVVILLILVLMGRI